MKDIRTPIARSIEEASRADLSSLRKFLLTNQEEPLVVTGSGGAETAADFAALLYGARGGVSTYMSPYTFNSLSDRALKTAKILLVSKRGHNNDIVFASKRSLEANPSRSASFTLDNSEENKVRKVFAKAGRYSQSHDIPVTAEDGFVSVGSPVAFFAMLCKVFDPGLELTRFVCPENPYRLVRNGGENFSIQEITEVSNFIILHGSWGRPVAANIEGKLIESGLASASVYDYRNFCHGRFIYLSNHLEDTAVIMLVSPREKDIAEKVRRFLPEGTKVILIQTTEDSPAASLDLLVKSTEFMFDLCDAANVSLVSPKNPARIDKRVPISIPFIAELKKNGTLTIR